MAQKLYTEQQVRKIFETLSNNTGYDYSMDDYIFHESLSSIELPSDEEIIKNAPNTPKNADDYLISNKIGFVQGAKWMKEQILNQNK